MIGLNLSEDRALNSGYRKEKYIFEVVNQYGIKKTSLEVVDGNANISVNAIDEVKRQGSFVFRKNALVDFLTDRIKPVMLIELPGGRWASWDKGQYCFNTVPEKYTNGETMIEAECMDSSVKLQQSRYETKTVYSVGTKYTDVIAAILLKCGFARTNIIMNSNVLMEDLVLDDSKTDIEWINYLAEQINYRQLYIDDYNVPCLIPYVQPSSNNIEYTYRDNQYSVLTPEIEVTADYWNVPNVIKRTVSTADTALTATWRNDNPGSRFSTVSRGLTIPDFQTVDSIASQTELDTLVSNLGFESQQLSQEITGKTLNMPHHTVYDMYAVFRKEVEGIFLETGWEMELTPGGTMSHKAKKVVYNG